MIDGPDDRLERTLTRILWIGSLTSSALLAIGLAWMIVDPSSRASSGAIRMGLFVLMATPASRVLLSVIEYARQRDWLFVAVTTAVLLVLGGSIVAALEGW